jgi:hypothetical protein
MKESKDRAVVRAVMGSRAMREIRKAVVAYEYDHPIGGKHKVFWSHDMGRSGWVALNLKTHKIVETGVYSGMHPTDKPGAATLLEKRIEKLLDAHYE